MVYLFFLQKKAFRSKNVKFDLTCTKPANLCVKISVCARYPIPVLIVGLAAAIGCSVGIMYLEVTTDPVKLWASPQSRSRVEKNFFDSSFAPFYRTEMLIIRPVNVSSVSYVHCLIV